MTERRLRILAEGFERKIMTNVGIKPINPIQCGVQKCPSDYSFGPAIRDFWLLHFVISGKGVFTKGNNTYSVKENEIFVIRPYETAYYKADKDEPWKYIWIGFSTDAQLPDVLTNEDVINAPHLRQTFTSAYYDDFFTETRTDGAYEYFRCGKIWEILGKLIQLNRKPPSVYESYVRPAIGMMISEYQSALTVGDIAKRLHISYGYFSDIFRAETGMTPKKYLNKLRLNKAVLMMTLRGFNATLAANAVGYPDVFAFSRAFKRHFGCSPTEYVKSHSGENATVNIKSESERMQMNKE